MRLTFGLALIAWGLITIFILPGDVVANKFINYVILGVYVIAVAWWLAQGQSAWTAYWCAAAAITTVVTFGDLSIK